jgi:hypothetical protein
MIRALSTVGRALRRAFVCVLTVLAYMAAMWAWAMCLLAVFGCGVAIVLCAAAAVALILVERTIGSVARATRRELTAVRRLRLICVQVAATNAALNRTNALRDALAAPIDPAGKLWERSEGQVARVRAAAERGHPSHVKHRGLTSMQPRTDPPHMTAMKWSTAFCSLLTAALLTFGVASAQAARPSTAKERAAITKQIRSASPYFSKAVVVNVTMSTAGPFALGWVRSKHGTPSRKQIQSAWALFRHDKAGHWKFWADPVHEPCNLPAAVKADLTIPALNGVPASSVCPYPG